MYAHLCAWDRCARVVELEVQKRRLLQLREDYGMVFDEYTKKRILLYNGQGYRPSRIAALLHEEGLSGSSRGVAKFLARYKKTGSISRLPGSGRCSLVSEAVKVIVEQQMQNDDETTASQLQVLLSSKGFTLCLSTILRCRKSLGWTFRGSAYCQMIRQANKVKRLDWARTYAHEADAGFLDVIFTDETSIQLESHRRFCCRKVGEPPKPKPRYVRVHDVHVYTCPCFRLCMYLRFFSYYRAKHPVKVHVWGGISLRGRTCLCIFEGKMDATMYVDICDLPSSPLLTTYTQIHTDSCRTTTLSILRD